MSSYDQTMQEVLKFAASPQGKQLIRLLQQKDPQQLQSLLQQASAGNLSQAKQTLDLLLEDPQTKALLESLGGNNGK